jgi:DNA repair exonuclease SbcCD nuclease subunit
MGTLKFITFTDVHVSVVNPASRKGSYLDDIFNKLNQIKIVGEKLAVDFFLFAGDLFNLKAPMRNPHELNSKLIDLFKSFPAPIYATEGNHDLRNDSYTTFSEQPLQVIYSSGALIQARDVRKLMKDMKIRIRSFPFSEDPDLEALPKADPSAYDLNICLLHIYSKPDGGNLFSHKLYSYDEIASLGDDVFVLGHYHVDQGIEILEKSGKKQIMINVGAISRGTLDEDNAERIPKIGYVQIEMRDGKPEYTCRTIRLNVKPYTEVFDVEKKQEHKKKLEEARIFVNKLQSDLMVSSEDEDRVREEVNNLDIEKEVMDKVIHFLDEADFSRKSIEA